MSLATGNELNAETFNEFVQRLGHHVRGEGVDWHHTADAIFTVQYREVVFGIDRDYTDKLAVGVDGGMYFSPKEYWDEADEDLRARLDEIAEEEGETKFLSLDESDQWDILGELPEHTVSGWDERWVHLNSHFTKEAAEAFIARKKHDYRKGLRVYVEAQVYCWEFNAIISGLLDGKIVFAQAATEAAKATGTAGEHSHQGNRYGNLTDAEYIEMTRQEAARQPAPVVAIKSWPDRMYSGIKTLSPTSAMQDEIADLRKALETRASVVLSDTEIIDLCAKDFPEMFHHTDDQWLINFARAILAATNRSQPAPVVAAEIDKEALRTEVRLRGRIHQLEDEIADLRAALAARNQP